jgi:hypothetical protein
LVKKSWVTFVLATTLLGLTGCANNDKNGANDNANNLGVNNVRNNTNNGVNVRNVSNQNLRVSKRAVRNVESLNEVVKAHVILRNNDAYVAVRLKNDQTGTRVRGGNGTGTNLNATRGNGNDNGTLGTNRTGTNWTGTTGTGPNMNTTYGNGYNSGTTGINGSTNLSNTTGNNTDNTGTNVTRNNARGGTNVSSTLEQRIADQVRAADRSINNVYVSSDTNTFGQMTNYSNNIRTGTNRNGLWNDFTNSVNRMFR